MPNNTFYGYIPPLFRNIEECNSVFSGNKFILRYLPEGTLHSSQYCSGNERSYTTPGDLGGPSVIREYNDGVQYYLFGVVSGVALNNTVYVSISHNEVSIQNSKSETKVV